MRHKVFISAEYWVSLLAVFLIFSNPVLAEDAEDNEITPDQGHIFNVQLENDLFGGGTDRHYTHGTRFSYLSPEKLTDFEKGVKSNLLSWVPEFFQPKTRRISLVLGQNMFTPEDISRTDLIADDQPYAGWLYLGAGLVAEQPTGKRPFLDNLEINFGMIGPASLAEETQTEVHRIKGVQLPEGWKHQLDNEFAFVMYYERKWPLRTRINFGGVTADLTPSLGFALGTVHTYLATGGTVRIGIDLPNDYGPPKIRPGLSGSGFFKPKDRFSWYVFAGIEGRAVGRNIFLDGNTFSDSHSVDKKTLVGDVQVGIVISAFRQFRLGFTNVFRTKEFDGQKEADEFGSINLSYRW
jgi:hypothetical protein